MSRHDVRVVPDALAVARDGAELLAAALRGAVAARGACTAALSGGTTPRAAFKRLAAMELPWGAITFFQVDERVAPDGDPDRNLTHLREALHGVDVAIEAMPVGEADLERAADEYAAALPATFDVIHLGIGADGHTASLIPGDPVLEVTDRLVALTGHYQGRPRMTLTYPALARTEEVLWLIAGADKREALQKLVARDPSVPAGRVDVDPPRSVIVCDAASA